MCMYINTICVCIFSSFEYTIYDKDIFNKCIIIKLFCM